MIEEPKEKKYQITIVLLCILGISLCGLGIFTLHEKNRYKEENAALSHRVESLEYRLYELNLKETRTCFTEMLAANKTCDVPNTTDYILCPQLHKCDAIFSENEPWYKDW